MKSDSESDEIVKASRAKDYSHEEIDLQKIISETIVISEGTKEFVDKSWQVLELIKLLYYLEERNIGKDLRLINHSYNEQKKVKLFLNKKLDKML